jgi:hypothetical protein
MIRRQKFYNKENFRTKKSNKFGTLILMTGLTEGEIPFLIAMATVEDDFKDVSVGGEQKI